MSRGRGWIPWVGLVAVVVAVVVWAVWPSGDQTDAERVRNITHQLRCPDCESLSAGDSQTASARAIRRDVTQRVAEGQSAATIKRAYVDRYGESILLEPERDGIGLVVWGLPLLVLVGGGVGLFFAFRRWRNAAPVHATEADEELVREMRRGDGAS
ncbi:MAG: cytochrome c-type biogenesis protein CcmH [Actinobacteria bacterium]|nr:cytochrome c-type biogenesis protein CcmH [Actinomycetota bacterium]